MKAKKIIALVLSAILLLTCFAGCAKTEKNKLEGIKDSGELHVALSPDFAPMEFCDTSKSGQDQYVGFDVTLAQFIADYLDVELVIEAMSFEACQAAVSTGNVDMSISGYSLTDERAKNFMISDYYQTNNESNQVIIALKDNASAYTSVESFDGKTLSAQNASLQYDLLTAQLPNAVPNLITDLGVAVLEVINGQVDALCCAVGQAKIFCETYSELAICPWEFDIEDEGNVVLMQKGEEALCAEVNKALAACADQWAGWYEEANELATSEFAQEVSIED